MLYGPLGLHTIYIPFVGKYEIGIPYFFIALFAIMGTAHATNLTDGLDSLLGGLAAIAFIAYGVIAYLQGQLQIVAFCFTMVGALIGFLWYNAHPAQVFMGDTGSLAIGAGLAVAAFQTGQWLILPVVGFVFVVVTLSVFIQVGYFKTVGRQARLQEGAAAPSFRTDRLVGDAGADALLARRDRGGDARHRPRALVGTGR